MKTKHYDSFTIIAMLCVNLFNNYIVVLLGRQSFQLSVLTCVMPNGHCL